MSSKCFHLCISDGTDHSFNNDVQSNQSNKIWFLPSRSFQFSSVQISRSVVSDSLQPHAACQASLSITNSWSSLKLMSIELVMPSNHLILCHPLFLLPPIPPSIRVFSNESTLPMRWLKYWSFSFSISPSNEHPGLTHSDCMLSGYFLQLIQFSRSFVSNSCNPMNRSTPGLPVHHQLPEFTQTHVHWVGDAIQPSHPLLSPSPPAPNPSQHQSFFQWVNSSHEVAKVLEFQL